ncbi:MAG: hypothetical protein ACRC3B_19535, partial [Bacteroidia bacterium]
MSLLDHKFQREVLNFLYKRRNESGMSSFAHIVISSKLRDHIIKANLAYLETEKLISIDIDYRKLGSIEG